MIVEMREYQEKHLDEMSAAMSIYQDDFEKRGQMFTAVLYYSAEPLQHSHIVGKFRRRDLFLPLEENLHFFIFEDTGIEGGIVAAEKLLVLYQNRYNQAIYVVASGSDSGRKGKLLIRHLFTILEFAGEHHRSNEVLDGGYLDGVY